MAEGSDAMDVDKPTTVRLKIKTSASPRKPGGKADVDESMTLTGLFNDYQVRETYGVLEDVTLGDFIRKRKAKESLENRRKRRRTATNGALKYCVGGKKRLNWTTLSHNGVVFPEPYKAHGVKMLYAGEPVELTPEQEEVATHFSRYIKTDHYQKPQFRTNFFAGFKKMLGRNHVIKSFAKCDFTPITTYMEEQNAIRKARSKEEKAAEKKEKEATKEKFGYAIIDGRREKLGNFTVEPPGLFLGRGNHPKSGMIKKRVIPEQITLNLSKDAEVPPCPIEGHKWGEIVHNPEVSWVACWKENINGDNKYVLFGPDSSIRGRSDRSKFETVRKLKGIIDTIRADYKAELTSKDMHTRQRATAMWIIDKLALRVGNEKNDDKADTVGCCSLRVEHVKNVEDSKIEFDFLGKDSMRYQNTVTVPAVIYKNFLRFCKGKKDGDKIFDHLSTVALNKHLKSYMPGLSAKVFRTFNASFTMEKELEKWDESDNDWVDAKKNQFFNNANKTVAILCNHQRTVSKNHATAMDKMDQKIQDQKDMLDLLKERKRLLKAGKTIEPVMVDGKKRVLGKTVEAVNKKIKQTKERINKLNIDKNQKDALKTVALGTSKLNYIDPRIVIGWCKRSKLPVKKVFPKTTRDKFTWALEELEDNPEWKF